MSARKLVVLVVGIGLVSSSVAFGKGDGRKREGGRRERPSAEQLIERLDKNEDGKLAQDEVPERLWEKLSRVDANKDGAVTKEEIAEARKNHAGGRKGEPEGAGWAAGGRAPPRPPRRRRQSGARRTPRGGTRGAGGCGGLRGRL